MAISFIRLIERFFHCNITDSESESSFVHSKENLFQEDVKATPSLRIQFLEQFSPEDLLFGNIRPQGGSREVVESSFLPLGESNYYFYNPSTTRWEPRPDAPSSIRKEYNDRLSQLKKKKNDPPSTVSECL